MNESFKCLGTAIEQSNKTQIGLYIVQFLQLYVARHTNARIISLMPGLLNGIRSVGWSPLFKLTVGLRVNTVKNELKLSITAVNCLNTDSTRCESVACVVCINIASNDSLSLMQ